MAIGLEASGQSPSVEAWQQTTDSFTNFYQDIGFRQVETVGLVAHHDPTLYFTNSTTSVMKPELLDGRTLDATFMLQPAMGSQGIDAWRKDKYLGPYASYFHSMAALYPPEDAIMAAEDMYALAIERLGINDRNLRFMVHESDSDLIDMVDTGELPVEISNGDTEDYRHSYGHERLSGRNALLVNSYGGKMAIIGCLTIIEYDHAQRAVEAAFDTTPLVAEKLVLTHPIDAYPDQIQSDNMTDTQRRIATDAAVVSSALFAERLEPKSRGKNRILRKFFAEFVDLSKADGNDEGEIIDHLVAVSVSEAAIRSGFMNIDYDTHSTNVREVADLWVPRLYNR